MAGHPQTQAPGGGGRAGGRRLYPRLEHKEIVLLHTLPRAILSVLRRRKKHPHSPRSTRCAEAAPPSPQQTTTAAANAAFSSSSSSLGWRQDNGNRSNQESKFDFLATHQRLVKIYEGQQKIKIVRTNRQSNLRGSCQSIFSLCRHHPTLHKEKNSNQFIFFLVGQRVSPHPHPPGRGAISFHVF